MIGSGALVFAVMGYVVANQVLDAEVGSQVELNPKLLSFILGESEEDVLRAIVFLCSKDPKSRTPDCDGRRLEKLGEYSYRVVNGAKYAKMRNEDDRRRQNREAKRRERAKPKSVPLPGENCYVRTLEREGQSAADAQMDREQGHGGMRITEGKPGEMVVEMKRQLEASGPKPVAGGGSDMGNPITETAGQRAEREYMEKLKNAWPPGLPVKSSLNPTCDDGK